MKTADSINNWTKKNTRRWKGYKHTRNDNKMQYAAKCVDASYQLKDK